MQSFGDTTKASSSKQAAAPWPSTTPVDPDHDPDHDTAPETAPPQFRRRRLTPWSPAWHWTKLTLRCAATMTAAAGIPIAAATHGEGTRAPLRFGLPAHVAALAYDLAEWAVVQRHFRARRGMRPAVTAGAEASLVVLHAVLLALYLYIMLGGYWAPNWFGRGGWGWPVLCMGIAIVARIVLAGRAANEVYRLRMTTASGDAIRYFHDADTNEPPARVVVPSWHGVDAEAGGMEPPSGYRDADEQGSTDKVFLPSPSRE
ncbi:hypothetical protein VD0002_g1285 [Verticillium dahliae]|uniref:Uncharacterized protein n=2 Tax=Verticillium dahliae TaxID=27337 RepID=G2WR13_VERDV|nr:uncharacterized protein VDAG_00794 [Verticillium dahliae VdLs.17]KAH6706720.1 hypothetical protein EV126DRAFT_510344 [Verticillium dahliae]EGY14112.1 hypothetical protein VDAG_00794 [Verticillium dahliae VdLs.17]PNH33337.1 hypothetical protein BJF96_g3608 [Verticillium dahliae]PNH54903.1 hypothetical protein VD0003_g2681 [Verticillium dahliae]PNH68887.1 hypothetical protein VD0002_g1285 [Verticillium dahliae]